MTRPKPKQKLIAFTYNSPDFEAVKQDMKAGWNIVSLIKNGNYYVGIMEEANQNNVDEPDSIFIPAKKKLKISS